jgi:acetyl-CoA C-acetyltransferase
VKRAVIVSGLRTPIGSFMGGLSSLTAPELGSATIKGILEQSKVAKSEINEVIMGHVLQGGVGQAPARQASLGAGLSTHVPCTTVNKVCGSGLKAVMMAEDAILLGKSNAVIAGGMESMSNAPYILPGARAGFRMGNHTAVDLMIHDGLFDPYGKAHMGSFGDMCAREYHFSRAQQDEFAHESYRRALDAQKKGYFAEEIIPVAVKQKGEVKHIANDEEPMRYQADKMPLLKPAFDTQGSVTAANASKINDGAAALLVTSENFAKSMNLDIKARIVASATFAHDPEWFTTAPVFAIKSALAQASLNTGDIDLYEINEAFSVVALYAIKELNLKREQVNVFGGAVALGHPIGCSGARLVVTLLNALKTYNKRLGCVSLCLGGGEAVAMIVERA